LKVYRSANAQKNLHKLDWLLSLVRPVLHTSKYNQVMKLL